MIKNCVLSLSTVCAFIVAPSAFAAAKPKVLFCFRDLQPSKPNESKVTEPSMLSAALSQVPKKTRQFSIRKGDLVLRIQIGNKHYLGHAVELSKGESPDHLNLWTDNRQLLLQIPIASIGDVQVANARADALIDGKNLGLFLNRVSFANHQLRASLQNEGGLLSEQNADFRVQLKMLDVFSGEVLPGGFFSPVPKASEQVANATPNYFYVANQNTNLKTQRGAKEKIVNWTPEGKSQLVPVIVSNAQSDRNEIKEAKINESLNSSGALDLLKFQEELESLPLLHRTMLFRALAFYLFTVSHQDSRIREAGWSWVQNPVNITTYFSKHPGEFSALVEHHEGDLFLTEGETLQKHFASAMSYSTAKQLKEAGWSAVVNKSKRLIDEAKNLGISAHDLLDLLLPDSQLSLHIKSLKFVEEGQKNSKVFDRVAEKIDALVAPIEFLDAEQKLVLTNYLRIRWGMAQSGQILNYSDILLPTRDNGRDQIQVWRKANRGSRSPKLDKPKNLRFTQANGKEIEMIDFAETLVSKNPELFLSFSRETTGPLAVLTLQEQLVFNRAELTVREKQALLDAFLRAIPEVDPSLLRYSNLQLGLRDANPDNLLQWIRVLQKVGHRKFPPGKPSPEAILQEQFSPELAPSGKASSVYTRRSLTPNGFDVIWTLGPSEHLEQIFAANQEPFREGKNSRRAAKALSNYFLYVAFGSGRNLDPSNPVHAAFLKSILGLESSYTSTVKTLEDIKFANGKTLLYEAETRTRRDLNARGLGLIQNFDALDSRFTTLKQRAKRRAVSAVPADKAELAMNVWSVYAWLSGLTRSGNSGQVYSLNKLQSVAGRILSTDSRVESRRPSAWELVYAIQNLRKWASNAVEKFNLREDGVEVSQGSSQDTETLSEALAVFTLNFVAERIRQKEDELGEQSFTEVLFTPATADFRNNPPPRVFFSDSPGFSVDMTYWIQASLAAFFDHNFEQKFSVNSVELKNFFHRPTQLTWSEVCEEFTPTESRVVQNTVSLSAAMEQRLGTYEKRFLARIAVQQWTSGVPIKALVSKNWKQLEYVTLVLGKRRVYVQVQQGVSNSIQVLNFASNLEQLNNIANSLSYPNQVPENEQNPSYRH